MSSKMSANFFRRLTLGMALVSQTLLALEDGKIDKSEIVLLLNNLFQGLGSEVNFAGLSVTTNEDGDLVVIIPSEILDKLS